MSINSINSEFTLIKKLVDISPTTHEHLTVGIGDDAAVIKSNNDSLILVTTDMLVEETHFKKKWSSPEQIGMKAVECNISDIAAMGGKPTFMFVSLILPYNTSPSWVESLYKGMNLSCNKYNLTLAGGDTTHGGLCAINITLLGKVSSQKLCLRSHAQHGDFLAVTGYLGGSAAGLKTLSLEQNLSDYLLEKHITPKCRLNEALTISSNVNAMIDISDGLSSEIHHICNSSNTGAEIYETYLPIHEEVKIVAKRNNMEALDFALAGGEDLELLFSFNPNQIRSLNETGVTYYIVGRITESEKDCVIITKSGKKLLLQGGYDHFT